MGLSTSGAITFSSYIYISFIKPEDEKDRNNTSQWNTIQIKLLIINNVFSFILLLLPKPVIMGNAEINR